MGSCAGYRRLLANEVPDTFAGEVQGCGVAFRSLFGCLPDIFVRVDSRSKDRGNDVLGRLRMDINLIRVCKSVWQIMGKTWQTVWRIPLWIAALHKGNVVIYLPVILQRS